MPTPFLWYDDQAEGASNFYVSVFSARPGSGDRGPSKVLAVTRYGEAGPGTTGSVMTVSFVLDGQEFVALNGGRQGFSFNESVSFVVHCENQDEVDHFWDALTEGGEPGPCGWLKDRFGLSWQIVPRELNELVSDPDPERARRAMEAMLEMGKIEVEALRQAADAA